MNSIFLILFISYILLFLISLRFRDNSIVDIFWGVGFMMIAGISFFLSVKQIPQIMITGLVILWGIRIVSHIGFRKLKERKEDARYAKWREEWGSGWYFIVRSFLQVYMLQMILMVFVSSAILVTNLSDSNSFSLLVLVFGMTFSLLGLALETIADMQLSKFIKIKKPGEIFKQGLYKYSRHPNYFGESVFWFGISLISIQYSYIGITSWLLITFLLLFVSGVPLQESRYEGRPDWEEYKRKTSVFIPWFPGK